MDSNNTTQFKDNIKKIRISKGYDRDTAAALIGISHQTLGHYETGRREPSLKVLKKMAKIYDVTVGELFGEQPLSKTKKESLLKDVVVALHENGLLKKSQKFDELDNASQEILKGVINQVLSEIEE